ncbi:MAG: hypothetical protein R3E48_11865 [Burkholderiaceae bacterium]
MDTPGQGRHDDDQAQPCRQAAGARHRLRAGRWLGIDELACDLVDQFAFCGLRFFVADAPSIALALDLAASIAIDGEATGRIVVDRRGT